MNKRSLEELIQDIKILKKHIKTDKYDDPLKYTSFCYAISQLRRENKLKQPYALQKIVEKGVGCHAYFPDHVMMMNPLKKMFIEENPQLIRHMWLDQLINDYTKLLESFK